MHIFAVFTQKTYNFLDIYVIINYESTTCKHSNCHIQQI